MQVPTSLWDPTATAPSTTTRGATYPEIFDHCLYQDYDYVMGRRPAWSFTEVATNKSAGTEKGVIKYMSPELRAVFKFVMYTWYEPATYNAADQTAIVDKIYASYTPPATAPAFTAGTKYARADQIVAAMNAYIAANKVW
jgi:hypothetical protein